MDEKIYAEIVLEIIGRPPEYIKEALAQIITQLEKEEKINVITKQIHESKKIENSKDLYSSFAVIELEADDIKTFSMILFRYMPSNVEIIKPEKIIQTNFDINAFFNELTRKLHKYDEIAKRAMMEKNILQAQLKDLVEKGRIKGPLGVPKPRKNVQKNQLSQKKPEKKETKKKTKSKSRKKSGSKKSKKEKKKK